MPETTTPTDSPSAGDPSEIKVVIDRILPEELAEFRLWELYGRPWSIVARRQARRHAIRVLVAIPISLVALTVALMVAALLLPSRAREIIPVAWLLAVAFLCAWGFFPLAVLLTRHRAYARRIRRQLVAAGPIHINPRKLRINRDGVTSTHAGTTAHRSWSRYVFVQETPLLLIATLDNGTVTWVPRRVFGEAEVQAERLRLTNEWLRAGGGGQEASVVPILQQEGITCPVCGYDLHGLKSPQCPECGFLLDPHMLPPPRTQNRPDEPT